MRLINAARLEVHSFGDELKRPEYVILSHTWGNSEVTLEDMRDLHSADPATRERVRSMAGYQKIERACQQALNDGFAYIWVDTCCIDKTSSAELSEAINSMFKWYQLAERCYAWLEDIEAMHVSYPYYSQPSTGNFITKEELSKARWFTRGWTLQELIAPEEVIFYAKGWKYIGTKEVMAPMLASITGISESALLGGDLRRESVAKRMGWMSRRQATRTEDLAYSLLGIFDISMPLLYGEGRKAFVRLQEEIMKDSDDHSLFAWTPSVSSRVRRLDPRSALAYSPREFKIFSSIYPSPFRQGAGEPYALTNKGIKIQLHLLPYKPPGRTETNLFLAILECYYTNPDLLGCRPGIVIQRLSEHGSQYCRSSNVHIFPVSCEDIEKSFLETLFLCKIVPTWVYTELHAPLLERTTSSISQSSYRC